jgi:hypothetical protein
MMLFRSCTGIRHLNRSSFTCQLRQEAQLRLPDGRTAGAIIEDYAGDTGAVATLLDADDTGNRLAVVLPLLRSLRAIKVYLPETSGPTRSSPESWK